MTDGETSSVIFCDLHAKERVSRMYVLCMYICMHARVHPRYRTLLSARAFDLRERGGGTLLVAPRSERY